MLQVSLSAGPLGSGRNRRSKSATKSRRGLSARFAALRAIGQGWFQGGSVDSLNDHMLQDIGVSRADIEALKL